MMNMMLLLMMMMLMMVVMNMVMRMMMMPMMMMMMMMSNGPYQSLPSWLPACLGNRPYPTRQILVQNHAQLVPASHN